MQSNLTERQRSEIDRLILFVAPILVYPQTSQGMEGWITGGSASLCQTTRNRFLITADHVMQEIDRLKAERDIVVLLGGTDTAPIDISQWPVVARDDSVDICTLQVPTDFEADELNKDFFSLDGWPLRSAEPDDQALILGFPAAHRYGQALTINTRMLPIFSSVTDVGYRRFTIADEHERREIAINPDNLEFPAHLGGMSGSPVFNIAGDAYPELLGVFSQGGDGLRGVYFCSHAHFLLPDGKLDFARIPPR